MNDTKPTANAASTVVSTPSLTGRTPPGRRPGGARPRGRARPAPGRDRRRMPRGPRQRTAAKPTPSSASSDTAPGTSHAATSNPPPSGVASTRGPYSSTSAALISALLLPSAIRRRMNSRSRSATGEVETFSAVPHSTHITSSSTSGSVVFGSAARAGAATARTRSTASTIRTASAYPRALVSAGPRGRCPMVKTVASQATNGGSIPLARFGTGRKGRGASKYANHGRCAARRRGIHARRLWW